MQKIVYVSEESLSSEPAFNFESAVNKINELIAQSNSELSITVCLNESTHLFHQLDCDERDAIDEAFDHWVWDN